MDVRIGVEYSPRELQIELPDGADGDALQDQIGKAIADGDSVLWITDRRGRRVGVPAGKITFVEIGSPDDDRRVGFGA